MRNGTADTKLNSNHRRNLKASQKLQSKQVKPASVQIAKGAANCAPRTKHLLAAKSLGTIFLLPRTRAAHLILPRDGQGQQRRQYKQEALTTRSARGFTFGSFILKGVTLRCSIMPNGGNWPTQNANVLTMCRFELLHNSMDFWPCQKLGA